MMGTERNDGIGAKAGISRGKRKRVGHADCVRQEPEKHQEEQDNQNGGH